jgi:hypothetical protein
MDSSSGPAQFHFNNQNFQTPSIEIHLSDSLGAHTKNMTMIINIGNVVVKESSWINFNNLNLNVHFTSLKDVDSAN